jgi:hypothetical protein
MPASQTRSEGYPIGEAASGGMGAISQPANQSESGPGQSRRFGEVCDMSALPAVMMQCRERQKGANSCREQVQQTTPLFDHLVGAREKRRRHDEAQHIGGLDIDNQFELGRLEDWQVDRLGAIEDTAGINADLTIHVRNVGAVAHQATCFNMIPVRICRRNGMPRR